MCPLRAWASHFLTEDLGSPQPVQGPLPGSMEKIQTTLDGTHEDHGEKYLWGSGLEQALFRGAGRRHQAGRGVVWEAQSRMSEAVHASSPGGRGIERERDRDRDKDREREKEIEREIPDL